ncbi:MAG: DUF2017 family protein, partial [Roseimicrobium sp.]
SRLFPSPVEKKDARKERTFIDDWKEYVTDDLENHFASDVGTLLADLDNVERQEANEDGEVKAQLEVPIEHAQAWFSALNQARLMLDKKFLLFPQGEEDFRPVLEEEEAQGIDLQERLQVYMRYEFFSAVQEWLVKHAF